MVRARTAGRRLLLQSGSQGRASCRSSPGLPWCAASRRLCWLRAADHAGRHRTGGVLGPRTTQVLRSARSDRLTDRRRGHAADRRTLCDREINPGPQRRGASSCRNTSARPLIKMMKPWLEMELGRVPPAGPLAEAIRYALARWPALTQFLDDGRIELDNNPVERAIRPIALGRKNHLFAGSDGGGVRWATICSLIATAKLNNVEPCGATIKMGIP